MNMNPFNPFKWFDEFFDDGAGGLVALGVFILVGFVGFLIVLGLLALAYHFMEFSK
jgi:hypothetical protein